MSAAEALEAARAAGIRFGTDGGDLVLEASAPPPPAVLDLLSRHKAEIVTLLRAADDGWSAEDWQVFFDERAGIAEFDGGTSRGHAESRALQGCISEWLHRDLARAADATRCLHCGTALGETTGVAVAGSAGGHLSLHDRCHTGWIRKRTAEAVASLDRLGLAWGSALEKGDAHGEA